MSTPTQCKIITANNLTGLYNKYAAWLDEVQDEHYNVEIIDIQQSKETLEQQELLKGYGIMMQKLMPTSQDNLQPPSENELEAREEELNDFFDKGSKYFLLITFVFDGV